MDALSQSILDFWFGPPPHASRAEWFRKDERFDDAIRAHFGDAVGVALAGGYGEWCVTAHGALARILLLDQFTRNIHRGTPLAFAGDERALATAQDAVARGLDRELDTFERWFCYLPYEHSEDAAVQERSLELFSTLATDTGDRSPYEWAEKHAAIVRRFGRYPHRNAILGRASTPDEIDFLKQPGSSF
jgi:uncharacterized protein (DUF924 family)